MSVGRMNRRAFGAAWSLNYALVSLVIIASWPAPVEARDIYTTLTDNAGESCHERDCRPAHYRRTAAGVEMLVGEEWTAVPDETIQYRALEGGRNGRRPLVWHNKASHNNNLLCSSAAAADVVVDVVVHNGVADLWGTVRQVEQAQGLRALIESKPGVKRIEHYLTCHGELLSMI